MQVKTSEVQTRRNVPRVVIHLWLLPIILAIGIVVAYIISKPHADGYNDYLSVVWSFYAPIAVVGLIGVCSGMRRAHDHIDLSTFTGSVDELVIIQIPTLCHSGNLPALKRVVSSVLLHAPANLNNYRVDVVADEGDDDVRFGMTLFREWLAEVGAANVRLIPVPLDYMTPRGAKFKTRANQYAMERRRRQGNNSRDVFVYHIDDDTSVGTDTVASIAEFITNNRDGKHLIAQGILAFPRELTPSTFANLADSVRPADDATRFKFFTGLLGTPLGGLHGEHLLARADIEEQIGWDFPNTVIEDAFFALQFAELYPGRAAWLNSFCYGASPSNIKDFVRQRRRWAEGLLKLVFKRGIHWKVRFPLFYTVMCWVLAPFQFLGFILLIDYAFNLSTIEPSTHWVQWTWVFGLGFLLWQYILGFRVNNRASLNPRPGWHAVVLVPLLVVFAAVESYGALLGVLRAVRIMKGQTVSEVIAKPM
jgi:egghead protein (zeste-white 4 protein)